MDKQLAIWWLAQADYEAMGGEAHWYAGSVEFWNARGVSIGVNDGGILWVDTLDIPDYIKSEVVSRSGRAGRGRLWTCDGIQLDGIVWDDSKPMAQRAANCGGIVIPIEDVPKVKRYSGFVTDLELNAI